MKKHWLLYILFFVIFSKISAQNKPFQTIETPKNTPIGLIAISSNQEYIAASSAVKYDKKNWVWIWNLKTKELLYSFDGHQQEVQKLVFSPNSRYLVSAGGYEAGKNIFCFDLQSKNNVILKKNPSQDVIYKPEGVTSIFFPHDDEFWAAGLDGFVAKFDLDNYENINKKDFYAYSSKITPLINNAYYDMEASEKYVGLVGKQDKTGGVLLLTERASFIEDRYAKKIMLRKKIENDYFTSIIFNKNNEYVLAMTNKKNIIVLDINNNFEETNYQSFGLQKIKKHHQESIYFYGLTENNQIVAYNINTMQAQKTIIRTENKINDFVITNDGQTLLTATNNGKIEFFNSNNIQEELNQYINSMMKEWLEKGKFEKTDAYIARTTPEKQNQQAQNFAQTYLKNKFIPQIEVKKGEYDADNETFKLNIGILGNLIVKVPISEAESFDNAVADERVDIDKIEFCFANNQVTIKKAKLMNEVNKKVYNYESGNNVFDNHITYKPVLVDINTPSFPSQNVITPKKEVEIENELVNNIPKSNKKNINAVAVIIGNAKYQKTQSVDFAINDAQLMKKYVIDVLGFSEGNIIYVENATYIDFKLIFGGKDNPKGKLFNTIKPNISDVFVYYSGHGAPDLNNKKAYFVPVEADPQYVELTCFEADIFYDNLAKIPAKSMTVVLDACFSGTNIYKNISPIVIKSKGALGLKNGALLASCASDQVSSWYNQKGQSLFTYFFLKAIHNKNADKNKNNQLTMQEIYDYVSDNAEGVPYYARRLHAIQQNPVLNGQNLNKVLVEW
ncbi:MAG: hypothetical protein EAZ20_01435 [Bacteroidetes bacterium]|nr:MAG: hypothetical protein EAZ20_01435 [Bacteroidota bacterium]